MKKFADFITKKHILVLFIGLLLLVPSIIGYINTRINYDILVYLPEEIDTIKGERILTKDFGIGSYAFVMIDSKDNYKVLKLEEKVKKIKGVNKVFSEADILGTTIPKEISLLSICSSLESISLGNSLTMLNSLLFSLILLLKRSFLFLNP